MVEEKCNNCKFFHNLKHNFEVGKGYENSSCCVLFTKDSKDGDEYDSFVVEVTPDSICEMFARKEKRNDLC